MSGLKPKEDLNLKSDFRNCTMDPPNNQVSSHRTNMLLTVQRQEDHMPTTIRSVFPRQTDELLEDKHLKCTVTSQMSDKLLLAKSGNVSGVMREGVLARKDEVGSSIDWEFDETSENMNSGLKLSTLDNMELWRTESSSLNDGGPDMLGKLTSVVSTNNHQRRKRKMDTSDAPEDLNTVVSFDSQASDELSKGKQLNGSQIKISHVRSLLRPETNKVRLGADEWEKGNSDMELKPAISEQINKKKKMPDFDSEQTGSSLDNDINWDPQKAFITFLWDNLDNQNQKKTAEVSAQIVRQQRVSKDTDYANSLCVNFTQKTQSGQHDHTVPIFVKTPGTIQIVRRKYNKDNVKGTKRCISGTREGTEQISTGCELSVLKEEPLESGSDSEPLVYPWTNCDIICKDRALLHSDIREHEEPVNPVQTLSLVCRECGWSFSNSAALLQHRSVHNERRQRLTEEMKDGNDSDDMDRDVSLQHALCLYENEIPDTFAQQKTHEKYKLDYSKEVTVHNSHSLATCNIYRNEILKMKKDTLPVIFSNVDADNNDVPLKGTKKQNAVTGSCHFENSETANYFALSGQYPLSASPLSFQKLEGSPSRGKYSYSKSERKSNLKIGNTSQKHDKGFKSAIRKLVNLPISQNGDMQASHDHRSVAKEWRTGNFVGFSNCRDHCSKTIFREECKTSAQENKDNSSHTSEPTCPTQQIDITDSNFQWQEDIKDIKRKHFYITQPLENDYSLKNITTPPHGMKVHDGALHLPVCKHSLQKEEPSNFSVKDSQKPAAIKLEAIDVGHVGPKGGSSLFVENSGRKDEMKIQSIIDEGNIKDGDCVHSSETLLKAEPWPDSDSGEEGCPCCPAMFETGLSLSDHTSRHLKVGVRYSAQHIIPSPEMTFLDEHPPTCGKITSVDGRNKEDSEQIDQVHAESLDELTCPLCGMRFDSKTGLSNHVRGHLKRLGKAYSTTTIRSPLDILKQLMSKKEEFQKTVQAFHKRHSTSKKHSRNDPFLLSITSVAKNYLNCCEPLAEGGDKNNRFEITDSGKCSPSSDLIGMLKKRRSHELKSTNHTTRKALALPLQHSEFLSEKKKNNSKVCRHCNETFHSGVSLSNHLRAYEKRKRAALHYGKTYDCKRKRSRSGSKKNIFPVPYASEEMYRLTCRFCDLVFQGPLSVQEDWIKHLQRHIINTSVPHTGACMVEVTSWPMDCISETRTETSLFLTEVLT